MKRALHIALRLIATSLMATAARAQTGGPAMGPESTEPGFVSFELTGVFERDLTVRFAGETPLLPFTAFANSLGIINHISKDLDTIGGEMPLGQPFAITIGDGRLRRRGLDEALPPGSITIADGEVYIAAGVLARALGLQIPFDLSELKLTVIADARIPAVENARNRHRYASLGHEGAETTAGAPIRRELFGSAAIRWGINHTLQNGRSNASGAAQIAGPFLFGVLTASGVGGYDPRRPGSLGGALNAVGWSVAFPDFSPLRQASLEASRSGASTSLTLSLGNAPLGGRRAFGSRALDGSAPPGWDVELYQDQKLVEVTRADQYGAYHFQVPIGYGATTRTIVQVGPHGERVEEERTFRLNPALVPPGELQYAASLKSASVRLDDRVRGEGSVGIGIFNWLTLGSAATMDSRDVRSVGPDSVDLAIEASLLLGDGTPMGMYYNPRGWSIGGSIAYAFGDRASVEAGIDSLDVRHPSAYTASAGFNAGIGPISLGAFGRLSNGDMMTTVSASPGLSIHAGGLSVNASTRLAWTQPRAALGGGPTHLAAASTVQIAAAPFGGAFMMARGSYDHTSRSFTTADFSASISLASALTLGISYSAAAPDWKHGSLYAQLGYTFGLARAGIGATYQGGQFAAANSLEGGVLISRGGLRAAPYEAVNQSGVIINAYHDSNLNGVRDDGEEILENPSADMDGDAVTMHTDDGTFLSLTPYQASAVTITHEGFAERGLYPRRSSFAIYTLPGATTVIDVPYADGFDVLGRGRVESRTTPGREGSMAVLTGLKVGLVSTDGSAEYGGEAFDDGTILVEGVSAGYYRIVFDDAQLAARGLRAAGLPAMVYLNNAGRTLPPISFAPRDPSGAPAR